jgi:hypothetical protein
MRTSRWAPSVVPEWVSRTVYLVENDFSRVRRPLRRIANTLTWIRPTALLEGQYGHPIRIVAFKTAERWSEDFTTTLLTNYASDATCNCATYLH